jgi:hypothetical protein
MVRVDQAATFVDLSKTLLCLSLFGRRPAPQDRSSSQARSPVLRNPEEIAVYVGSVCSPFSALEKRGKDLEFQPAGGRAH